MVAIDLPADVEHRLETLAKASGRSAAAYAQEVILEHLEDLEDIQIAEERLAAVRAGRSTSISLEEVMRKHGLSD